jgi:hypothetical protein
MPSSFTVSVEGFDVTCGSAADALALIREAKAGENGEHPPRNRGGRPPKAGKSAKDIKRLAEMRKTQAFLNLVLAGNVDADQIVEALNLEGKRGVGGALVTVKRVVREFGFADVETVFEMNRDGSETEWAACPEAKKAYDVITAAIVKEEKAG